MSEILSCKLSELPTKFPGIPLPELKKMRKRAQNARWQQQYRSDGRDGGRKYDGSPIGTCREERHFRENAVIGSANLLATLQRTGLRP